MPKKCIICGAEAKFSIKDANVHYCEECAKEHFADVSMLVKVEDEAKRLKKMLEEADSDLDKINQEMDTAVSIKETEPEKPEKDKPNKKSGKKKQ